MVKVRVVLGKVHLEVDAHLPVDDLGHEGQVVAVLEACPHPVVIDDGLGGT